MILLCVFLSTNTYAQIEKDTAQQAEKSKTIKKSPLKASLYSAVLPGAGQVYNGKIWKVPIIYAGIGSFSYLALQHQSEFTRFKSALLKRQNGESDEFEGILNKDALLNEMDKYRRFRDLNLIGATLIYVLQIIDANVDASLSDFDVSDDLSFYLKPNNTINNRYMAMGLTIKF